MRAGNLRNYVEIKQPPLTETFDANGELITTPIHFAYAWASIEPLVGREYWASRQVVSEVTGTIKLRYIAGVKTTMKVIDGLKTYDIEAVIDVENRHEELTLLVKENP
jgi:SPP1 family predicted phage head-tail adaptor